jgi:hypothetical protein
MTYTPDALARMTDEFFHVAPKYQHLSAEYLSFSTTHSASREYTLHGFIRRLGTLQRCIQNVFALYHPSRSDIPSRDTCVDLTINLQSFVFNVFGCLDNLARIWVIERNVTNSDGSPLRDNQIGFLRKIVKASYADEFRTYIDEIHQWFGHLENYRHALAHRIPLYIAPFVITPTNEAAFKTLETAKETALRQRNFALYDELDGQQTSLGKFVPAMTHSLFAEDRYIVYFHAQILADWNTIVEIADRFLHQCEVNPDLAITGR